MNTSSSDLSKWKSGAAKECYKKLFEPISKDDDQVTYMSRILEKVWTDSDTHRLHLQSVFVKNF